MTFGLFLPSRFAANVGGADDAKKENAPVMYWLSGLTCDGMLYMMCSFSSRACVI